MKTKQRNRRTRRNRKTRKRGGTQQANPLQANSQQNNTQANAQQNNALNKPKQSLSSRAASTITSGVSRALTSVSSAFTSQLSKNISEAKKLYGKDHYLLNLLVSDVEGEDVLACKILINDAEIDKLRISVNLLHTVPYTSNQLMRIAQNILSDCKKNQCFAPTGTLSDKTTKDIRNFKTLYKP